MNVSRIIKHLKTDEGLRLYPYRCPADKLTIGYGRNIEDKGFTREEKAHIVGEPITDSQFEGYLKEHGITLAGAEMLLVNDIKDSIDEVKDIIGDEPFSKLNSIRQEVLINMCFNMGAPSFKSFESMIKNVRLGLYKKAAEEIKNSLYYENEDTHSRAKQLYLSFYKNKWVE